MSEEEIIEINPYLKKQILKEGVGNTPQHQQEVLFHFILRGQDKQFLCGTELQHFTATIGQDMVQWYIEESLKTMKIGERCLVQIENPLFDEKLNDLDKQNYVFENFGEQKSLELEIEIIRFGTLKNNDWDLTPDQRLERGNKLKQEGNTYIKSQQYEEARNIYAQAYKIVKNDNYEDLKNSLLNNLSLAYLKLKEYENCINTCTQALETQPKNIKLFYRLGQAQVGQEEYGEAKKTYQKGLQIDPSSAELKKEFENVKAMEKKILQKKQAQFSKMFQ